MNRLRRCASRKAGSGVPFPGLLAIAAAFAAGCEFDGADGRIGSATNRTEVTGWIETVTGAIYSEDLGSALTHEHVMIDWIGADRYSTDRYNPREVFAVMLPHLRRLRGAGIDALFDTTPEYLGRDPALLKRLSEASGLRIITCTGIYYDGYIPSWMKSASAEAIADLWTREAEQGCGDTGVRPGFIKVAMLDQPLDELHRKMIRAAALTSKRTGLTIACHTTSIANGLEEVAILEDVGVSPERLIIVHADANPDLEGHAQLAEKGVWLSYDGIHEESAEFKAGLVMKALKRWPDQLLISQDAGWYSVGMPGGGEVRPYDWMPTEFIPRLRRLGATQEEIDLLLSINPRRALAIR